MELNQEKLNEFLGRMVEKYLVEDAPIDLECR